MPEAAWIPEKIYIDESVLREKRTVAIVERLHRIPAETIHGAEELRDKTQQTPHPAAQGKRSLFLTRHKGKFLSICPAFTESAVCCNYRTINVIMGCNFDCSYCFLQAYLDHPIITFYVNLEDMFAELEDVLKSRPAQTFRFGTGEFTDSLSLDHVLEINGELVDFFTRHENAFLELKTKSARVDALLDLDHRQKTIIAWSLNTDAIQKTEEHKTATIEERILAARRCVEAGYGVAFHFDPLIIHADWQNGYRETVKKLCDHIPEDAIAWISYGSLRYVPDLKRKALARFRSTPIFSEEFIKGFDGKMRYFTPLRNRLYQAMDQLIRDAYPKIKPYLCMEPEHIWESTFGQVAPNTAGLTNRLDTDAKHGEHIRTAS